MKRLFMALTFLGIFLTGPVEAAWQGYNQATFDQLQQQNKPVLVLVHADWCTTCKAQVQVLNELLPQPGFNQITVVRVDYDKQKEVMKQFGVRERSTLILFKGKKEIARSTAETSKEAISSFLHQVL